MKTNKSYFSHDSNARNSDKLLKVRMDLGAEGYAIYFMILERLREEDDYISKNDYMMIAYDLRVDEEKVKKVINDYDLFIVDDDVFYSKSFMERMNIKDLKRLKAQESINKRWDKEKNKRNDDEYERNTNVLQTYNERNTDLYKEKKRKEKESKVKKSKEKQSKENTVKNCNAPSAERRVRTFAFESLVVEKYGKDECLIDTFKDFAIMRKAIKKPLTERATKILLGKLDKLANDDKELVIKILEQSILNNWQSVYELKDGVNYGNSRYSKPNATTTSQTKDKWDEYDFGDSGL